MTLRTYIREIYARATSRNLPFEINLSKSALIRLNLSFRTKNVVYY